MKRIFSGVQPTGNLHLGNYLGAIRNFVGLQNDYDCIYCVVDLHAITLWQEPEELRRNTREVTAAYLAAGIDPDALIIFNQSQVPAHAELAWIFNCVARLGWLNRMTQFKEKAGKHRENASAGLYVYPNLMAADILAYKATHVPVGEDQKQHLELTRDIAQKFNNDFGVEFFPLPEPLIFGAATRVMSLRDGRKKMSKSDASAMSRINMTDDAGRHRKKKIRKATTDPTPCPAPRRSPPTAACADELPGANVRRRATCWASTRPSPSEPGRRPRTIRVAGSSRKPSRARLTDLAVAKLGPDGRRDEAPDGRARPASTSRAPGRRRAGPRSPIPIREVKEIVGFLRP